MMMLTEEAYRLVEALSNGVRPITRNPKWRALVALATLVVRLERQTNRVRTRLGALEYQRRYERETMEANARLAARVSALERSCQCGDSDLSR